jgi:hypothetical protein
MHMKMEEWNTALDTGEVVPINEMETKYGEGRLMIYQIFKGKVKYKDKLWFVTAWAPPGGDSPYVDLEEIV